MIIGISGRAGSGKTTLANVAVDKYNFTRVSFAAVLKVELITYLREHACIFNPDNFYGTPEEKNQLIGITPSVGMIVPHHPIAHIQTMTYREALQWYGDKKREDNSDYWLQQFMLTTDFSQDLIVDDVRFTNEAALLQAMGGIIVRISWPARLTPSSHVSETQMDNFPTFDSVITKDQDISLAEYEGICIDHLALWLGQLDELTGSSSACHATSTFNLSSLQASHNGRAK